MHTAHARRSAIHAMSRRSPSRQPGPLVDEVLRGIVAIGALIVLMLPEARGSHPMLGWLPLWLLGMPLMAWWAAHRFQLPGRQRESEAAITMPRRRAPQALRRDPILRHARPALRAKRPRLMA